MTRATRAIIDIDALQHNLNVARRAAPDSRVMAVIKANGYGHGIVEVAHALQQAEAFAVACIDEAITLREAGITQPIVLLEGFTRSGDLNLLQGFNLQPVIHHESQLALLEQSEVQPPVLWIKLDTGMHRLGFSIEQWPQLQARVHKLQQTSQLCYMTHLANADDRDDGFTHQQIGRFDQTLNHPTVTSSIELMGQEFVYC